MMCTRNSSIALATVLSFVLLVPLTFGQTTRRPISDFVQTQGTLCIDNGSGGCFLFVPPVPNFVGWGDATSSMGISVDYAGLANTCFGNAFGTKTTGTVTERALADGRAEVTVLLFTKNALTWVVQPLDFANGPVIFGHRWNASSPCVLDGTPPALGNSFLETKFINTAPGDPLPDLLQLIFFPKPGQQLTEYVFQAQATGTLANGESGSVTVAQTANPVVRSNVQAAVINLRPTGK
jgi:hypothetical protein